MYTITLALKENRNEGPVLDDDSSSDLVNRIGKKVERIGLLHNSQKSEILMRAQSGGFIRWHILSFEQTIISSTYRSDCMNIFPASITLEEPPRTPVLLERTELCKFVRDLGSDLEQLQRLQRFQVVTIWYGLEKAGFVERCWVQEAITGNPPLGICKMDVPQPTAPSSAPYPTMSVPLTSGPSNDISQIFYDSGSWMNDMRSYEHYAGGDIDWILDSTQTPDESTLCMMSETIPLVAPQPILGVASPAETTSTPGLDGSTSSYPTPSTMCPETPQMRERSPPELGTTILDQAAKRKRLDGDRSKQSKKTAIATKSNQTILHLLQSCAFYQVDKSKEDRNQRLRRVLEAEVRLSIKDPCRVLRPRLSEWSDNMSLNLHALGLPAVWIGIEAAVNYICVLDAHATKPFLDPVAERIGQVLLHLNCEELCSHPEKYFPLPIPIPKMVKTFVYNSILDAYSDDPRKAMPEQSRRNRISSYHVRRGRWWWKLAGTLGVGILLIADSTLQSIMFNHTFSNGQFDALATFALNTRPGTIRVFRALEPVVKSLMFGQVTDDLQAILNDEFGLLGQHELACAYAEDEAALARQRIENPWTEVSTEKHATEKMHEFLASVLAT